jgi:hypothetical protein
MEQIDKIRMWRDFIFFRAWGMFNSCSHLAYAKNSLVAYIYIYIYIYWCSNTWRAEHAWWKPACHTECARAVVLLLERSWWWTRRITFVLYMIVSTVPHHLVNVRARSPANARSVFLLLLAFRFLAEIWNSSCCMHPRHSKCARSRPTHNNHVACEAAVRVQRVT